MIHSHGWCRRIPVVAFTNRHRNRDPGLPPHCVPPLVWITWCGYSVVPTWYWFASARTSCTIGTSTLCTVHVSSSTVYAAISIPGHVQGEFVFARFCMMGLLDRDGFSLSGLGNQHGKPETSESPPPITCGSHSYDVILNKFIILTRKYLTLLYHPSFRSTK